MRELNLTEIENVSGGHIDLTPRTRGPGGIPIEQFGGVDGGSIGGVVGGAICLSSGAGAWASGACSLAGMAIGNAAEGFLGDLGAGISQMQNADQTFDPSIQTNTGEEVGLNLAAGQHGGHGYANSGTLGSTPMGGNN